MVGVRADGSKELVAVVDGYRKSAESWADLPRDCCGMSHLRDAFRQPPYRFLQQARFWCHERASSPSDALNPWVEAKASDVPGQAHTVMASPTGASSSGLRRTRRGPVRDVLAPTLRPRRGVVFS